MELVSSMERARILLATAERYRLMAGTITDPAIAQRLLDYADELGAKGAELVALAGGGGPPGAGGR